MVFLLVITSCASIALLTLVALAAQINGSETRREQQARADLAMQGAVANIRNQMKAGSLTVPSTQTITIDNFACVATTSSNNGNVANSYQIAITTNRWNRTYSLTRITGLPFNATNSIYKYAIALNAASTASTITTSDASHKAGVYSNGALNFGSNGSVIDGDANFTTPSTGHAVTVNGTTNTSFPALTWPTLSDATYTAAATTTVGSTSVSNINLGAGYPLVVVNGNLTLNGGTVTGYATYYVTGNINVYGDVTYANGSSLLCLISKGTLNFGNHVALNAVCFVGDISMGVGDTFPDTVLCFTNAASFSRAVALTYDFRIRDGGALGKNMYLPGLWP